MPRHHVGGLVAPGKPVRIRAIFLFGSSMLLIWLTKTSHTEAAQRRRSDCQSICQERLPAYSRRLAAVSRAIVSFPDWLCTAFNRFRKFIDRPDGGLIAPVEGG